jgi:hypothetical protein
MSSEDPFPGCEASYLKACWALQILYTGWLIKEESHSEVSEFDPQSHVCILYSSQTENIAIPNIQFYNCEEHWWGWGNKKTKQNKTKQNKESPQNSRCQMHDMKQELY